MSAGEDRDAPGLLRPILRWIRYAPDRLLHPGRRRRARRTLAGSPPPRRVIFLCLGNICRSPYAAAVFRRELPDPWAERIEVESAGFYPVPDRPSPSQAIRAARRRGVDLTGHRSQVVSDLKAHPGLLVVGMTADQARRAREGWGLPPDQTLVLGDLDPEPVERRTIPDPWGRPEEAFDAAYERIDRCVREMVGAMFDGPG